ncbi:MAG TPA: DJ-1/PfpI family protein [Candidatus Polarisedimenticolaceae bacterium]|nr:DJ-1/PfpI family protein [Candidatus Polarisedimenticolaceae bacterium]
MNPPLAALVLVPALSASLAAAGEAAPKTRNVAIVAHDGMEILDFAGPSEVFAAAGGFGAVAGVPAFRVYTVGITKAPIVSQGFVKITPEFSIEDAPKPDILVIAGGGGATLMNDPKMMAWIKEVSSKAELSLTVCTGAFVLAKTGLLDGREVTTWYDAIPRLKEAAPTLKVQDGRRFVDTGNVVTTAGVSAGIDGSLHVVARLLGRSVADRTARYMEYHWTPEPYLAKQYAYLNPSLDEHGRTLQQAGILEEEGRSKEAAATYRSMLAASPDDAFAWYRLGVNLQRSGDLAGAVEAARKAARSERLRGSALYNLACAYALQGKKDDALEALEQAVAAGFSSKGQIETDDDLVSIRNEARFRKVVTSL